MNINEGFIEDVECPNCGWPFATNETKIGTDCYLCGFFESDNDDSENNIPSKRITKKASQFTELYKKLANELGFEIDITINQNTGDNFLIEEELLKMKLPNDFYKFVIMYFFVGFDPNM